MFAYIGPYKSYIGPYQIADFLEHFCVVERDRDAIGKWLSKTWVNDFCQWLEGKRKRTIFVKVHNYDSWNADETMSILILPVLKQLRLNKHGSGYIADEDAPEHLRSTNAPPKENEWDTDDFFYDRHAWVLDEIIWTLEQKQPDVDWEQQFYSGDIDILWKKCDDNPELYEMETGPKDTFKVDYKGRNAYQKRIDNGMRLLFTYWDTLWD